MLYAARDSNGKICELHSSPRGRATEPVPASSLEAMQFASREWRRHELTALDLEFVRALEDTIELLIAKGVFLFTDLPPKVQEKLLQRKEIRGYKPITDGSANDVIPI